MVVETHFNQNLARRNLVPALGLEPASFQLSSYSLEFASYKILPYRLANMGKELNLKGLRERDTTTF